MKLNLLLLLSLPIAIYAQDSLSVKTTSSSPYASGRKTEKFDNKARKFRDWAISVGGGTALIHSADLTSFYDKKIIWGWNSYVSLDKQISHTFGLSAAYQMGETKQKGLFSAPPGAASAHTKYYQVALLGDLNLTSLMRRVDNHSPYRWGLHGYAGVGVQGYHTYLNSGKVTLTTPTGSTTYDYAKYPYDFKQPLALDSFFFEFGAGLLYNVNKYFDIEGRVMYISTGDDTFDGGGDIGIINPYNNINYRHSDNFFTTNLGLSFKLGKHPMHLRWFDPLQSAYSRTSYMQTQPTDILVCEKGDNDNDGVCDDWDRQLDTPSGARVDGAGVALDMDLDGVIDLNDKCVTIPGPMENNGCPVETKPAPTSPEPTPGSIEEINKYFEGIEFALNKDIIRPQSFEKLNHAADVIKTLDQTSKFGVIGCTDTRGKATANQILSEKRAKAVVKYLVEKGVSPELLIPEGHGDQDLKYPECRPATNCEEWKNEANRRVYFQKK